MLLPITFKNLDTGVQESGDVEYSDTLASINDQLKEGNLIANEPVFFYQSENNELAVDKTFRDLGIQPKETIRISTKKFSKTSSETKPTTPSVEVSYSEIEGDFEEDSGEYNDLDQVIASPQLFDQLGIFVLDGSHSMNSLDRDNRPKKEALNLAMQGIIGYIQDDSTIKENFSFSVVNFGEEADTMLKKTKVTKISRNMEFDSTKGHNKGTLIYKGLEKAESIALKFLKGQKPDDLKRSVVVVLLSDGECHNPSKTLEVARRLRSNKLITLCTTFLSTPGNEKKGAENLMKQMVKDSALEYKTTYDEESIRQFFIASSLRMN